ncbi:MAG TPA: FGGY family carbohydrate kinase [Rectinemataceae bacterium]|nr:FGGY family carbohydrate kinase [Rectinemataceae bacterium]
MRLGIDLGTGSLKAMAVEADGTVRLASAAYPVEARESGAAETEPELWLSALDEALASLGGAAGIECIGFSGQMHGVVPLSLRDGALAPAILWADQRGKEMVEEFRAAAAPFGERLVNAPAAGMAALTMMWLKRRRPELYDRTEVFLFPKDYLRWRLTGELATDRSDASGGLLYDLAADRWDGELIEALGLDAGKLPPLRGSAEIAGRVGPEAAARTGIPEGVAVATGAADTAAALYGSALSADRGVQISVGSGIQIARLLSRIPPYSPSLNVFAAAEDGLCFRMAAMLNGGIALEWARGLLGLGWEEAYAAFESRSRAPEGELMFLPYLSGERSPYMNPDARGAWLGLSLRHGPLDLLHAALLGVACTIRLGLETLGGAEGEELWFVGGSARYPYWTRLVSSVLARPLRLFDLSDLSARGAVALGAAAAGKGGRPEPRRSVLVEPERLGWIEDYYGRFKGAYLRLFSS